MDNAMTPVSKWLSDGTHVFTISDVAIMNMVRNLAGVRRSKADTEVLQAEFDRRYAEGCYK